MKKYVLFSCGRGPVESARAVYLISREFLKRFSKKGSIEVVEIEEHNNVPDCYMSIMFSIDADEEIIKYIEEKWKGTLCYRSTSNPYRPDHKRKNWFVSCCVIDPIELPEILEKDIKFESCRDGKHKGGQNQNVTESAVKATHIPTGISVISSEERSNAQNKQRAKERLLLRLNQINKKLEDDFRDETWNKHNEIVRGNPKITFSGKL